MCFRLNYLMALCNFFGTSLANIDQSIGVLGSINRFTFFWKKVSFLEKYFLIAHALTTSIKFVAIQVVKKSELLYPLHVMTGDVLPSCGPRCVYFFLVPIGVKCDLCFFKESSGF